MCLTFIIIYYLIFLTCFNLTKYFYRFLGLINTLLMTFLHLHSL